MKAYGNAATIPGGSRTGIPLPKGPVVHARGDIASRVEAARAFTSPIVMHSDREFTAAQLLRAGYKLQGVSGPRPSRAGTAPDPRIVARRADARRLYVDEGETMRSIAGILGVSVQTVKKDLHGVPRPKRKPRQTNPEIAARRADVVRLYSEGLSTRDISDRLEISLSTVGNDLDASGTKRRNARKRGNLAAVPDETIVDLYADGLSCRAIGERLDSSESAVHRRLQLAGVELRATGGPRA